ncbi:MAG: TIGR03013 family PEP-CTERM/XrtA system glycosyltransferase [Pseudomonadales bacterium]|nr:TIGR03013 family PEP-CTERM/XrtA system glycosyltransferase [Halioglobus sp.]MCP5129898.1 TIGR03013 family PEP-CTERM/XrtA system glycosyltransferase [Pseudomonadales bacterium]
MATVRVFNHHLHSSFYWLATIDAALFVLATYAGTYLYFLAEPGSFQDFMGQIPSRAALFAVISVLCLAAMGLYEPRMREGTSGILLRTIGGFFAAAVVMAAIFYVLPELHLWRGIYFYTAATAIILNLAARSAFTAVTHREEFKKRVLVYGAGEAASTITNTMRRRSDRQGFTIVGFVRIAEEESKIKGERVINLRQPLAEYTRQTEIDQVVIALDDKRESLPMEELFKCRLKGVDVFDLVTFFEREAGKILVDFATPGWMAFTEGFKNSPASDLAKRCFDLTASFILLMFSWPIMLLTAIAIGLEDGFKAPVFFRQKRVGLNGETFNVLKFRSMSVDAEGDGKAVWATRNDARVTRVGNFIRKTRIDELPQILNVLAGDMAFIGPRPERPEFVKDLAERIPYYNARHCVKPGITGWAQLCYPYGASENDARQKLQFDLYYVKNHSLFLDFMICLTTVEVVLFGKGAR